MPFLAFSAALILICPLRLPERPPWEFRTRLCCRHTVFSHHSLTYCVVIVRSHVCPPPELCGPSRAETLPRYLRTLHMALLSTPRWAGQQQKPRALGQQQAAWACPEKGSPLPLTHSGDTQPWLHMADQGVSEQCMPSASHCVGCQRLPETLAVTLSPLTTLLPHQPRKADDV